MDNMGFQLLRIKKNILTLKEKYEAQKKKNR